MEVHPIADKPILTIRGKRSFLENCLELANGKASKSFLNPLIISKEFLNVSKSYPIYCLDVSDASPDLDDFALMFMNTGTFNAAGHHSVDFPYISSKRFDLSCEQTCSIVSLLTPEHFSLTLANPNFSENALKNCADVFNCVTGKIGLFTYAHLKDEFTSLMNQFAAKINCMCMTDLLLSNDGLVSLPKLESCHVEKVINTGQLDNVLRHKIKELVIEINEEFLDEGSPDPAIKRLKLDECESLQNLFVKMPAFHETVILPLLNQVTARCPGLKKVHVYVPFEFKEIQSHTRITDVDEIVQRLLDHHAAVKKLVDGCKKWTFELIIWSSLAYHFGSEYDCDWVEAIKENENFRDLAHFHVSHPEETLHKCLISYSGDDQLLNFKQEVHVMYTNPEFEEQSKDSENQDDSSEDEE